MPIVIDSHQISSEKVTKMFDNVFSLLSGAVCKFSKMPNAGRPRKYHKLFCSDRPVFRIHMFLGLPDPDPSIIKQK
jgi:hypothetical protein